MFFRRTTVKKLSFEDHLTSARAEGFRTESAGSGTRVERNGVAAVVQAGPEDVPRIVEKPGVMMGKEIGALTDGGFQKFFVTPGGKRKPAQADELKEIQSFSEDLREAFGLTTLYNEALGTVSTNYIYDRVEGRDQGEHDKPWEVPAPSAR
jgi:hypothetical protein